MTALMRIMGGVVREEARKAKDMAMKAGMKVCLFSGRSSKEVKEFVKKEKLSDIFIAELGSVIHLPGRVIINHGDLGKYGGTGPIYERFIDEVKRSNSHDAMFKAGIVDAFLRKAAKRGWEVRVFTPKDGKPGEERANIMKKQGTVLLRGRIDFDEAGKIVHQEAPFIEILDNGLVEDDSGDHAYHMIISGVNKESAARILQNELGLNEEECVALGDSLSDLSLTIVVSKFFLMKNAFKHTPDILERFKKDLRMRFNEERTREILGRIAVTKKEGSLGWAEAVNEVL